jgi:anti-anti-sigma factor
MNVKSEQRGKVMVASVAGRIDFAGAADFGRALAPHLERCTAGGTPLLIDLAGVDYISSAGLRELLIAAKGVKARGGRMMVCGLQPMVKEVVRISRFDLVLQIVEDASTAQGQLDSSAP